MMNIRKLTGFCAACLLPLTTSAADYLITTDADFVQGNLQSLTLTPSNQLQISSTLSTFPVLWVANAGEDTLSKIDTKNECEVARYQTWFNSGIHSAWGGPAPSRTAVDGDGNVFVANRHFDNRPVAILKVLLEGGVDRNGNGVIDTSTDINNDCIIQPSEMIPLVDTNGNGVLDDAELADERVAFIEQIPGTTGHVGRSLCIDPNGFVWAGTYYNGAYYKLSPTDGTLVPPAVTGTGPNYGCVIDSNGILFGASLSNRMPVVDTNTHTLLGVRTHSGSDYSIAAGNGKIYKARAAGPYLIYDPNVGTGEPDGNPMTGTFLPQSGYSASYGIGVDGNGDIVQGNTVVRKFKGADNTYLWGTANPSGTGGTRGVLADSDNNVWAVNLDRNNVTKFNGATGAFINTVPVGASPYTYSDATGIGFQISNPTGIYTHTLDSGATGTKWDSVSWNNEPEGSVPTGTSLKVEARSADSKAGLGLEAYQEMASGTSGIGLMGQFIQLKATLMPDGNGTSPVLSDLLVKTEVGCDINNDGFVDRLDIGLITRARNTVAAPGDARDVDGSGVIDVNDARQCVLQCDLPRCTTPPQ